jgi:uncharacterized membrane protein YcaP (DUF421 family)
MWAMSLPWWEFVIRGLIIYVFLIVILRMTGRRQIGQMAPFDLVLLLVLSNGVQNSMNGGDNSVTAGIILSVTLIGLNTLVSYITFRWKKMERLIEGRPQILIHNGKIYEDMLALNKITHNEIEAALRRSGISAVDNVHYAILETNGDISVKGRPN